jgi:nucleoside-diphosphate-sugar epimerase
MGRVLVTGANGFVGRFVLQQLERSGLEGTAAVRRASNTRHFSKMFEVADVADETRWDRALTGVDAVVHLAARTHVIHETATDPLREFRRVNVTGTERLARAASVAGAKRLIYISSIGVNGDRTDKKPFSEEDTPRPTSHYAISKWEAERSLHRIACATGLEVVILRAPLVYGPGNPGNFLRLLQLINKGWPLPVGAIQNRLSLIYDLNLADAIVRCIHDSRAAGQTFLVSDGEDISTTELMSKLALALGRPLRLLSIPGVLLNLIGRVTGTGDAVQRLTCSLQVDSSRIRHELDWNPPYSMTEGLSATAEWYRRSIAKVSEMST